MRAPGPLAGRPVTRAAAGFSRRLRLRRGSDVRAVQSTGRRRRTRWFTLCVLPNDLGHARFGLAVSRKVGGAVVRNRVKRRLREAFRLLRPRLGGYDLVVLATPEAAKATFTELSEALAGAVPSGPMTR